MPSGRVGEFFPGDSRNLYPNRWITQVLSPEGHNGRNCSLSGCLAVDTVAAVGLGDNRAAEVADREIGEGRGAFLSRDVSEENEIFLISLSLHLSTGPDTQTLARSRRVEEQGSQLQCDDMSEPSAARSLLAQILSCMKNTSDFWTIKGQRVW